MSLQRLMAGHLRQVILNPSRNPEAVRGQYLAEGATEPFPITFALGDVSDEVVTVTNGRNQRSQISAAGSLSELLGGILTQLTEERSPLTGDEWTVAEGAYRGVWCVVTWSPDGVDGVVLTLRYERALTVAGAGTGGGGEG